MKRIACLVLVLAIGAMGVEISARTRKQNKPSKPRKRGQFVIAPIPVSSPAVGSGLVVVAGYVSTFDRNRYQTTLAFGKGRINYDFFTLEKKNHINYRVDWAVGRAGHTLTIGIGEAF